MSSGRFQRAFYWKTVIRLLRHKIKFHNKVFQRTGRTLYKWESSVTVERQKWERKRIPRLIAYLSSIGLSLHFVLFIYVSNSKLPTSFSKIIINSLRLYSIPDTVIWSDFAIVGWLGIRVCFHYSYDRKGKSRMCGNTDAWLESFKKDIKITLQTLFQIMTKNQRKLYVFSSITWKIWSQSW